MAESKNVVVSDADVFREAQIGDSRLLYARFDRNTTNVQVVHMTEMAAKAEIEVSNNRFAIPAQEETKRSIEETKRFRMRAVAYPLLLVVAIASITVNPGTAQWIALLVVGVLGSVEGLQMVDRILTRRGK